MAVPFIDLKRTNDLVRDEVLPAWTGVFERCEFVGGPSVSAVEQEIARQMGTKHAVSVANGTDALQIALQAAGVVAGDKVALPNLTFWATFEAVAQLGAVPVLIDIDPQDLQMSFAEFKAAFEKHRFKAAMLVHLYGWTSEHTTGFRQYCANNSIELIEDGAQCFGVQIKDRPVLADAKISTLSFYPAKVIGGAMDGGAIATNDDNLAALARSLANHGRAQHYSYAHVGWNSRMGGLQATFLKSMLQHSRKIVDDRAASARWYRENFAGMKARFYGPPAGVSENGYLNVFTVNGRTGDELQKAFKELGVATGRTYPETMDMQPPAKGRFVAISELTVSRGFCQQVCNLPLYFGMTERERTEVARAFEQVIG